MPLLNMLAFGVLNLRFLGEWENGKGDVRRSDGFGDEHVGTAPVEVVRMCGLGV